MKKAEKKEFIKMLKILSDHGVEQTDLYHFDFIRFINREVAPHISDKGLAILKREYESWIRDWSTLPKEYRDTHEDF